MESKVEYKGCSLEKEGKVWLVYTDLQEEGLPGYHAFMGWAPSKTKAKLLIDSFWSGDTVPEYELEALATDPLEEEENRFNGIINRLKYGN